MDMLDRLIIDYINKSILKNLEQLDQKISSNPDYPFIDVKIIKQTKRTYRVVGMLTLSANSFVQNEESPDEELKQLNYTPRKKVKMDDYNHRTFQWLENGWIIKEVRFKKDEKTVDSIYYRMGYRFHKYEEEQVHKNKILLDQEYQNWKENAVSFVVKLEQQISNKHKNGVQVLVNILFGIYHQSQQDLQVSSLFPVKWTLQKRLKFLHFVLAFIQLCSAKTNFDWKEIGAGYYKVIGGSKEFDMNKDEFITQLEEWAQYPADSLGLTSLGKITPLYFSGQLSGRFSTYHFGPVHALTDLAISAEEYSTEAATLWLVENRSILTRLAAEKDFLKETNSLVVCVDGHLRSSHKLCIQQLLRNGSPHQVIIWSDYDPDGFQIARELYFATIQYGSPLIKWITHELEVIVNWKEYEDYMLAFLNHRRVEQEQVLGGVEDWKKWIGH